MLGERCKVSNFVEMKNNRLGADVKASHPSYLGAARLGRGVTVAAGSSITQDVKDGALALARCPQVDKEAWHKPATPAETRQDPSFQGQNPYT
ncbi:MAG: hypothetical protein F4158_08990 [Synechococcus sp. SB0675_bin_7]|nr:hypothetical protein [Synechococcus sp. SB0675_bin_7]